MPSAYNYTRAVLEHFNLELFDNPSYSPELAPSDCHLFTYLKNNNNEGSMEGVKTWLSSQAADFFDASVQKLISPIRQVPQFRR
jgi:hypothetical protein